MATKVISIKLTKIPKGIVTFSIFDNFGNIIAQDVSIESLINGSSYTIDEAITIVTLKSFGACELTKSITLKTIPIEEYNNVKLVRKITGCIWSHLTNTQLYNSYYGMSRPYIIEYPFAYQNKDEILQNVIDYTKTYTYLSSASDFNSVARIETNDTYFNKAILYNGQQSTGILELVPKQLNNLQSYNTYPKYNKDSKTIVYTKTDNLYQYNTFWALNKTSTEPLFITSCLNNSIDKVVNQDNMDYSSRSFTKAPLRAKELKIRHILDNKSDVHMVSQFIISPSQISHK